MEHEIRVIETQYITIKLLNGKSIQVRPLTLFERKECIYLLPSSDKILEGDQNAFETYMKIQGDIIFFVLSRSNKDIKREDIDNLLDTSMIEQIFEFVLKDSFMSG